MKDLIHHFIDSRFPELASTSEALACAIAEHICSPKFTAIYMQRSLPMPECRLGSNLNSLELTMSKLTDAMTALGQQIAASNSTSNAAHFQVIDDHLTKLDSEESADEATIADTNDGLQALLTAAKGTPVATPAPTPAPTAAPAA